MRDFKKEIEELKTGVRKEIEVSTEDFLDFRKVWVLDSEHNKIVGKAHKGGKITYTYILEK